jgi:hypothetical protein
MIDLPKDENYLDEFNKKALAFKMTDSSKDENYLNEIKKKVVSLSALKEKIARASSPAAAALLLAEYKQQISGIPSDLLPGGLDISQAEEAFDKAMGAISSRTGAQYSQTEIDRIKREAEALKELEYGISNSMSKIDEYYQSKDTVERYEKYADIVAKGKDATAEEVEGSVSLYTANRNNEAENLEDFKKAKKEKQKLEEKLARLNKNSDEYKNISETIEKIDKHLSKAEKPIVNSLDKSIEFLRSPPIKDKVVAKTEDGKDITGNQEADLLQAKLNATFGNIGMEARLVQAESKSNKNINQSTDITSSPVSHAGDEKLVTALTNNTQPEMGPSIKPTPTPTLPKGSPPKGIKNRNQPITK